MIENEQAVMQELEEIARDQSVMGKYSELVGILSAQLEGNTDKTIQAQNKIEEIFKESPDKIIEALLNIMALNCGKEESLPSWHRLLCVTLASLIGQCQMDAENMDDREKVVRWTNKASYCLFRLGVDSERIQNTCLVFTRILALDDFFADPNFADEVYFRFLKKHISECQTESQLFKLLSLITAVSQEDSKIMTFCIPKILPDSMQALSQCANYLAKSLESTDLSKTLECFLKIHEVQQKLMDSLLENFAKYNTQSLDLISSPCMAEHLGTMLKFISTAEFATLELSESVTFRLHLVKIISGIIQIGHRFEVQAKAEAPEHQIKIAELVKNYDFKLIFPVLNGWVERITLECIELGQKLAQRDQKILIDYLHHSIECLCFSMEINPLCLYLLKNADKLYLSVATPVILTFDGIDVFEANSDEELFEREVNLYNSKVGSD